MGQERRGRMQFDVSLSGSDFLALAAAAISTERIQLGTSIALAFIRSPMAIAYTAVANEVVRALKSPASRKPRQVPLSPTG